MKYTVQWRRLNEPDAELTCRGLEPRTIVARLIRAIDNSGPIVIDAITLEAREA